MAKNLMSNRKSAWFSSSVPESIIEIWIDRNGLVEIDAFQADFLFAEDSEAEDLKCIYQSKEFLEGHLTVFHSDLISAAAKRETGLDITSFVLLPLKAFEEFGINLVQFVRKTKENSSNCGERKANHSTSACPKHFSSLIHTSASKRESTNSKKRRITEKYSTQKKVSKRKNRNIIVLECTGSCSSEDLDDNISEFSGTTDESSEGETFLGNEKFQKNCEILNQMVLFDIPHLNELQIPDVLLMDFHPTDYGCHMEHDLD